VRHNFRPRKERQSLVRRLTLVGRNRSPKGVHTVVQDFSTVYACVSAHVRYTHLHEVHHQIFSLHS
jgi:hypothetical protein